MKDGENETFLKIGHMTFRGQWRDTIGTQILLEQTDDGDDIRWVDQSKRCIQMQLVNMTPTNDEIAIDAEGQPAR
jgi:hypothetical protein